MNRLEEGTTRKIASAVAKIHLGKEDVLEVGNIHAKRDWGYSPDYVDAMWRMLMYKSPDDYVVATGKLHSVEDVLKTAFSIVNLEYENYVKVNPKCFRTEEKNPLLGDYSKALSILGWGPTKKFEEIIEEMVLSEIKLLKGDK